MKRFSKKFLARILAVVSAVSITALLAGCSVNVSVGSGGSVETGSGIESFPVDSFTSIEADLDIADIEITSGSEYLVKVDRTNYPEVKVEVANGKLVISEPGGIWIANSSSCTVEITVPVSARLSSIDLEVDTGDISVEDIASETLAASTDTGDISAIACGIDSYDASTDTGDIELLGIGDLDDASISASTDLGSITVGQKSASGSFTQSGTGTKIKAETDTGNITID